MSLHIPGMRNRDLLTQTPQAYLRPCGDRAKRSPPVLHIKYSEANVLAGPWCLNPLQDNNDMTLNYSQKVKCFVHEVQSSVKQQY